MANDQSNLHQPEARSQAKRANDEAIQTLRTLIAKKHAIVIVGPGIPYLATGMAVTALPRGLLESGIERCERITPEGPRHNRKLHALLDSPNLDDTLKLAFEIEVKLGAPHGQEFEAWLKEEVGSLSSRVASPAIVTAITNLGVPIATINLDTVIESVVPYSIAHMQDPQSITRFCDNQHASVLHLFGVWSDSPSVRLSGSYDHRGPNDNEQQSIDALSKYTRDKPLIIIGFAPEDVDLLIRHTTTAFKRALDPNLSYIMISNHNLINDILPLPFRKVQYGNDAHDLVALLQWLKPYDKIDPDERLNRPASDWVPYHSDNPATKDLLGRDDVAFVIWNMLKNTIDGFGPNAASSAAGESKPTREGAFLMHLHGPWGSGKSTLLNLICERNRKALRAGEPGWIVIHFNAWHHQHLGSAWWGLMDEVYRQGYDHLNQPEPAPQASAGKIRRQIFYGLRRIFQRIPQTHAAKRYWLQNIWWRVRSGWAPYLVALAMLASFFLIAPMVTGGKSSAPDSKPSDDFGLLRYVFFGIPAFGGLLALMTSFGLGTVGSARTAESFLKITRDPMRRVQSHYEHLIQRLGAPALILIDDLDRCEATYVVELLQAIMTAYRGAPAVYLVAADREWICMSYQQVYAGFVKAVHEQGRPLGYLFLEKVFQLSITVPALSNVARQCYVEELIAHKHIEEDPPVDLPFKSKVYKNLEGKTQSEILEEVIKHASEENDRGRSIAFSEAAIERLSAPPLIKEAIHFLFPYSHLFEQNPRSMKRLLNAYRFQRDLQITRHLLSRSKDLPSSPSEIDRLKLIVLWTIVELRWPLLAELLASRPSLAAGIGAEPLAKNTKLPRLFQSLQSNDDVVAVFQARGLPGHPQLNEATIRELIGANRSEGSSAAVSVA